jgi:SAM-dependent methyltransferase
LHLAGNVRTTAADAAHHTYAEAMKRAGARWVAAALAAGASAVALRARMNAASEVSPWTSERMKPYDPDAYTPDLLAHWIREGERQAAKDRLLLPRIVDLLGPGRVLELGAGAGQLTLLLRERGLDVIASDYAPFFVEHLVSLGLEARRVDATDIAAADIGAFPNVFAQSITPLITSDPDVVAETYRSLRSALIPGGRLVHIHAQAERKELTATMRAHAALASQAGLRDVRVERNQLLPSRAYDLPISPLLTLAERLLAPRLGSRFVLSATA